MANNPTTGIYASDLISTFDIYKPEVLNKLFRVRGDQGYEYLMTLKSLGFEMPVARDEYSHYEEGWIHDTFLIGANSAAGAANASVTLTVSPTSIKTYDANNIDIYPRLWDTVLFPDGTTASITLVTVTNGTTATVRVTPSVLGTSIPAIASGDEIVIISNAWAEGSSQPDSRLAGTEKATNYLQIIKETLTATGTEMTNQDWFDVLMGDNGDSNKILGYVMKGQLDIDYRQALSASNALLFQTPTSNTSADLVDSASATKSRVKTTEGLIPAIRRAGQVIPYPTGLFSIAKFNEINDTLDREFCGQDVLSLDGINLLTQIEDTMVNYFKNTDISYVSNSYFKGSEGLAMSVGFKSFTKSGRTYNFQKMGIFSHPKVGGATGYNYPSMGVFLPMNKKKDKKTGEAIPSFGCRYKELGAYSRKTEVWDVSGAGTGRKVTAQDTANFYQRMHIGAQHIGLNRMIILDPQ